MKVFEIATILAFLYFPCSPSCFQSSIFLLRSQLATLETMANNPAIATAISQIKVQISNKEHELCSSGKSDSEGRSVLVETFQNPSFFTTLPDSDKKSIYRALIDRIVLKDGQVVSVELKV